MVWVITHLNIKTECFIGIHRKLRRFWSVKRRANCLDIYSSACNGNACLCNKGNACKFGVLNTQFCILNVNSWSITEPYVNSFDLRIFSVLVIKARTCLAFWIKIAKAGIFWKKGLLAVWGIYKRANIRNFFVYFYGLFMRTKVIIPAILWQHTNLKASILCLVFHIPSACRQFKCLLSIRIARVLRSSAGKRNHIGICLRSTRITRVICFADIRLLNAVFIRTHPRWEARRCWFYAQILYDIWVIATFYANRKFLIGIYVHVIAAISICMKWLDMLFSVCSLSDFFKCKLGLFCIIDTQIARKVDSWAIAKRSSYIYRFRAVSLVGKFIDRWRRRCGMWARRNSPWIRNSLFMRITRRSLT